MGPGEVGWFGAGPRRCIGFASATVEIKALLATVVRRTDLELVSPADPGRAGTASMRPKAEVKVRVLSRTLNAYPA